MSHVDASGPRRLATLEPLQHRRHARVHDRQESSAFALFGQANYDLEDLMVNDNAAYRNVLRQAMAEFTYRIQ